MELAKVNTPAPFSVKVAVELEIALLMVILPLPIKIRLAPKALLIAFPLVGLNVRLPAAPSIVAAPFKVTKPLMALLVLVLLVVIAPIEFTPTPAIPILLAIITLNKAKVPPLATVTAEVPKALLLLTAKIVPLLIVVVPEKLLLPLNVSTAEPEKVIATGPDILPE